MYYDERGEITTAYRKAPLEILYSDTLKDFSKLLYFELYTLNLASPNNRGQSNEARVFIKNTTLAANFNVSDRYIANHLKELQDKGYIGRKTSSFNAKTKSKRREIVVNNLTSRTAKNEVAYIKFPQSIFKLNLRQSSKLLLIALMHLQRMHEYDKGRYCLINKTDLSSKLSKTPKTIQNGLKELEQAGYIETINKPNRIYVYVDEVGLFDPISHTTNTLPF